MAASKSLQKVIKKHLRTLEQYVPVVDRVHGAHHPEFHDVRALFDEITIKIRSAGDDQLDLDREFAGLRAITGNYKVPDDVCESYEAVYSMLAEMDEAYLAEG